MNDEDLIARLDILEMAARWTLRGVAVGIVIGFGAGTWFTLRTKRNT